MEDIELELTEMGQMALGETSAQAKHADEISEELRETAEWLNTEVWDQQTLYLGEELSGDLIELCTWGEENIPRHSGLLQQIRQTIEAER